jgi:hypothetical protein
VFPNKLTRNLKQSFTGRIGYRGYFEEPLQKAIRKLQRRGSEKGDCQKSRRTVGRFNAGSESDAPNGLELWRE